MAAGKGRVRATFAPDSSQQEPPAVFLDPSRSVETWSLPPAGHPRGESTTAGRLCVGGRSCSCGVERGWGRVCIWGDTGVCVPSPWHPARSLSGHVLGLRLSACHAASRPCAAASSHPFSLSPLSAPPPFLCILPGSASAPFFPPCLSGIFPLLCVPSCPSSWF